MMQKLDTTHWIEGGEYACFAGECASCGETVGYEEWDQNDATVARWIVTYLDRHGKETLAYCEACGEEVARKRQLQAHRDDRTALQSLTNWIVQGNG